MSVTRTHEAPQKLGAMVSGVTEDLSLLVKDQVALTKSELRDSARAAATSSALLVVAAFLGVLAVIFLLVTIAYVLVALGLSVWAGFGIVTLVLLVVTGILGGLGVRRFKSVHGPERSIHQLAEHQSLIPGRDASS